MLQKIENYNSALAQLEQAVAIYQKSQQDALYRDGLIQRFEFTVELSWKSLKEYLEDQGFVLAASSPRAVLKDAYAAGVIQDAERWNRILTARNITSHVYDEKTADGVAAQICDRIAVMYGGHIMELGPTRELFAHPQNPYTRGLLASLPVNKRKGEPLSAIPGTPPNLGEMPVGCPFAPRCARAQDVCFSQPPAEREVGPGHTCRCHFADGPCREEDDCGKPQ